MTYFDTSLLQQDQDFRNRVAAAYAHEQVADSVIPVGTNDPWAWASTYSWAMAAAPGFSDAYAYAIANGNLAPGKDPSVITDAQILAAVQFITNPAEEPPPEEPPEMNNELPDEETP